jgi:hypothetical protein
MRRLADTTAESETSVKRAPTIETCRLGGKALLSRPKGSSRRSLTELDAGTLKANFNRAVLQPEHPGAALFFPVCATRVGMMDRRSLRFCLAYSARGRSYYIILAADWPAAFFCAGSGSVCAVGGIEGSEFSSTHGEFQAGRARNRFRFVAVRALHGIGISGLRAVYSFCLAVHSRDGGGSWRNSHCHHRSRGKPRIRLQQPGLAELRGDVRAGH